MDRNVLGGADEQLRVLILRLQEQLDEQQQLARGDRSLFVDREASLEEMLRLMTGTLQIEVREKDEAQRALLEAQREAASLKLLLHAEHDKVRRAIWHSTLRTPPSTHA